MNLKKYDGHCVQILTEAGEVFEGVCTYNSKEYNEHEFGYGEEGLDIANYLFLRSDIKAIRSLEDHKGIYGRFTGPYGLREKMALEDGIHGIEDLLSSEEPEHIYRLLVCLEDRIRQQGSLGLPPFERLSDLLQALPVYGDPRIEEEIRRLLDLMK